MRVESPPTMLERVASRLTAGAERVVPDAYVFALVGTVVVVVAAWAGTASTLPEVVDLWGKGFFDLLPFTMQMSLVVIGGSIVASSRPVGALIERLAAWPRRPRGAVAFVALLAMLTAWLNWGFSLMFSAALAKAVARRVPGADYRALAASSFLGLGSVWAQGLSGSAALQMATPSALSEATRAIVAHGGVVRGGVVSLADTIFLPQSFISVVIEIVVVTLVVALAAPTGKRAVEMAKTAQIQDEEVERTPHVLERTPWLTLVFVALAVAYLVRVFWTARSPLLAISLDVVNLVLLSVGALLHWTPARLMRAVRAATPAVWGIVLQFPFYAGMAAVIAKTHLNESIASVFVRASTQRTFPALVAAYSAVLGVFVPSGGSKWVIEAPYVMRAAHELHVHLGWTVACYDLGEALANLVQPFWMLPVLAYFGLKARDVMGLTLLVFLVLVPVVLVMVVVLGATLTYPL